MNKRIVGNIVVIGLLLLNIVIWLVVRPNNAVAPDTTAQFMGELVASTAMIAMAIAIILATKPRWLEPYFGGLDKMYMTHRQIAMLGFLLLLAHKMIIPMGKSAFLAKRLGNVAYIGIIFLVLITIAPRIPLISRILRPPYHHWRLLHRLLGIFFAIGLLHSLRVNSIIKQTLPGGYMLVISAIAIIAWLYHVIVGTRRRQVNYTVQDVKKMNAVTSEITLEPSGENISFKSGQFAFVRFADSKLTEPHPFTISSSDKDKNLRMMIKGSGDWTRRLVRDLKPKTEAQIDGPYGLFNYQDGGSEQIWVAGGIGVTPFLSWLRSAEGSLGANVDFFYCVGNKEEALYLDEFEAASAAGDELVTHTQYSVEDGYLSADEIVSRSRGNITDKHIFFCGPVRMTEGFSKTFKEMGVPSSNIHYEEFNFR